MQKIVILINSLGGGGAERVVSTLLNELCFEYECYLILLENNIDYLLDNRINVICLNEDVNLSGIKKLIRLPFLAFKLAKIIKKFGFNQVTSFLYRANYINILSSFFAKHRVVISERIAPSAMYRNHSLEDMISKILLKTLYKKADLIISVSKAIEFDLIENFNIGVKQVVIYNPYDIESINNKANEKVGVGIDKKSIIAVGTLCDRKNQQLILRSFARIADNDYVLYLLGKGENEDKLKVLARELGIAKRVVFLGFDNNPYKYLSKCSIFILGSNAEGFPNVLAEAMVCGCAVISTDCLSGPREILAPKSDIKFELRDDIELAEFGVLVPVQDEVNLTKAIEVVIGDNELRGKYRQVAKERANDFNIDGIIKRYKEVICVG